ncbi:MAG: GAF domain-containing protein [Microscillaceae bacterium]|nr:GAF domain-containing protein [Microscillaceae bacterium]MDW8461773.1 GAF domain-containing protein [Cytophagales bacterium]
MTTIRFWISFFFFLLVIFNLIGYFFINQENSLIDELWFGLALLLLLAFFILLDRKVIRPLKAIKNQIGRLKEGNYAARIYYNQEDEVREIVEVINQITDSISRATKFVQAIENNQLDVKYEGIKNKKDLEKDTLAQALLRMQAHLLKLDREEKERNWKEQGLSDLSYLIRNNQNETIDKVADLVLTTIVEHLQAAQGAIFFAIKDLDNQPTHLVLKSCYACSENRILQKEIQLREGLVGQCFVKREIIFLEQIPQDYIQIQSGLGQAAPRSLILLPLQFNDQIIGVIEIASLYKLENYQIDYLERAVEVITANFIALESTERTKRLLEETQHQAEALRAQEEEMRQNMEELQATQEEMAKKQRELESSNAKMIANEKVLIKAFEKMKADDKKIRELLARTQQQAETLKAQEEKMRQNMEELLAAQEETAKKQREIEIANKKLADNEAILKKSIEKFKQKEKETAQMIDRLTKELHEAQNREAQLIATIEKLQTNDSQK